MWSGALVIAGRGPASDYRRICATLVSEKSDKIRHCAFDRNDMLLLEEMSWEDAWVGADSPLLEV
jgi:hypothetical protein